MYEVYFDKLLFPIAPSKISTQIKNQNKKMKLVSGDEINFLKSPGLTEIKMELILPNQKYPFANCKNGFKKAEYYINELDNLKTNKEPFQLIVIRKYGSDSDIFNTNMTVSLEEFTLKEDTKNASDVIAEVKLKKYVEFKTKTIKIIKEQPVPKSTPNRETKNSPEPKKEAQTYTVKSGDSLWAIAKKFYGNGKLYPKIADANKDKIKNPNLIYPGQLLTIPVL